jgi:murein DD-endopeptidase MepM/ murein hydrolase activator NlpD
MNSQILLNKPQTTITPKITKIGGLLTTSKEISKSSSKLKKIFEKGTYQKKTQLSILNRYKKRLESIQKQNDRSFRKRSQQKVKLPQIKKYTGSLFTLDSTKDPLRSLAALAAFKSFQKGSKGDWGGALGSGLVAAGLLFGPGLLGRGFGSMMNRGGGSPVTGVSGPPSSPSWWSKNPKSLSRANQSYSRFISGKSNIGDRARLARRGMISPAGMFSRGGPEQLAKQGKIAKAFGRFGKSIIPGVGAAVGAIDAGIRANEGDVTGASIAGASASLDAAALGLTATGIGVVPAAALSAISFGLDLVNLVRDLSGASEKESQKNKAQKVDRLPQQTEQQKKLVEKRKESSGELTFRKTLNGYERVVNKFEQISKAFKITPEGQFDEPPMPTPTKITHGAGYDGPISGDTFFPLPGGDVGSYGKVSAGQAFGGYREGRPEGHQGLDMTNQQGALDAPVSAYKTGKVVAAVSNGYNGFVEIDHGGGLRTLYYHTTPMVSVGEVVYGGQQIAKLYPAGGDTHLHFGISNGGRYTDPLPHVKAVKNKIPSPLTKERAKLQHQSQQSQSENGLSFPLAPPQPTLSQSLSIGAGGFNFDGMRLSQTQRSPQSQPQVQPQLQRPRQIERFPSYDSRSQVGQIIPLPIPQQQQNLMPSQISEPILLPGPSEQDLLNSFYKRVLLNTV